MSQIDCKKAIETAYSVNAAELAGPTAGQIFRSELASSIKCEFKLSKLQRDRVQYFLDFEPLFDGTKRPPGDHAELHALREITRVRFHDIFRIAHTVLPTLMVGSSHRELRQYNSNPNIHYHFYNSGYGETQDVHRTVKPFLEDLVTHLRKSVRKDNIKYLGNEDGTRYRSKILRFNSFKKLLDGYNEIDPEQHGFICRLDGSHRYNVLVSEDSAYNITGQQWIDYFSTTGALTACGYMLMPEEFVDPNIVANPLYAVMNEGDNTQFVYKTGHANGYSHNTKAWRTLLDNMIIRSDVDCGFYLKTEIKERVGPYIIYTIARHENHSYSGEQLIRNLRL